MGPGRWGSRGDIRLGVPVSYADISNSAVLVEVARQKGGYLPDLSFGTHFFQDLVESSIRYLPLYPDDPGVVFNEAFFLRSANALADLAPEFASLSDVLRVIDVAKARERPGAARADERRPRRGGRDAGLALRCRRAAPPAGHPGRGLVRGPLALAPAHGAADRGAPSTPRASG